MPINGFSVGRDISLVIVTSLGTMTFGGLTNFTADPMSTDLKSKLIDGTSIFGFIPDGWEGSFMIDRRDPSVDNYWAQVEADYYSGVNLQGGTISEIITEADGSVTEWKYTGVILRLKKAGEWGGDKKVEQSIGFQASLKVKVA